MSFNQFDWNARFDLLSPPDGNGITELGTGLLADARTRHFGTVLGSAEALVVAALASQSAVGVTSVVSVEGAPSGDATLEVEFSGVQLPADWSDVNTRVFIGLHGTTYSAGILVTSRMLLLARSIDDPHPQPLHGSGALLQGADGPTQSVVVRLTFDTEARRVGVYYARSADTYTESACAGDWRQVPLLTQQNNIQMPAKVVGGVSAAIETRAAAGTDVAITIESFRLADALLVPFTRPTAVLETTAQVAVNGMTWLNGAKSYDVAGASLDYRWSVVERPKGSLARLQGHQYPAASTAAAPPGSDVPVAGPADLIFIRNAIDNGYVVRFVVAGVNTPYGYVLADKVLTVTVATDVGGNPTTTAEEVLNSFQRVSAPGYDVTVASLFTCRYALLGASGLDTVHACDVTFSEGFDSSLPTLAFIPDAVGPYRFRLAVTNGGIFSAGTDAYVHCVPVDVATGYRPDASYVFKYLPDFWQRVKNREQLEAIWSGTVQMVASEIERVWQHDYSKSIRDISRKYTRRWVSFPTRVDLSGATVVQTGGAGTTDITWDPSNYSTTTRATVTGALTAGPALYRSTEQAPTVLLVAGATDASGGVVSVSPAISGYRELLRGSAGQMVATNQLRMPGEDLHALSATSDVVELRAHGQLVRMPITAVDVGANTVTMTMGAVRPGVGDVLAWRILRRVQRHTLTQQPYVSVPTGALTEMPQLGDLVELTVLDPTNGLSHPIHVPVVAAQPRVLLVQWDEYVRYLNASNQLQGLKPTWDANMAAGTVTAVVRLVRCGSLPALPDLQHVPTLGSTLSRDYYEGREYTIQQGAPSFYPLLEFTGTTHANETVLPYPRALPPVDAGGQTVLVLTGVDAGAYYAKYSQTVTPSRTEAHLQCAQKFTSDASVQLRVPRFSPGALPPATLWGEVGYFDNWRTIQNNFGTLVGLPRQDLDQAGVSADYLQIVKALAYGFVCGPTLENLGRVGDAFSGLPFVEHASQVVDLIDPTPEQAGSIVLLNPYGRLIRHAWPYGIPLALHPITGRPIAAFPVLDSYSTDIMALDAFVDAQLPAYTRLFGSVEALDYILDPERVDGVLAALYGPTGIIRRYRTIVLRVPLGQFSVTSGLNLLMRHVQEMAGADTFVVVLGVQQRFDDVPVTDYVHRRITLHPVDTPGTPAWTPADTSIDAPTVPFTFPQDPGKQFADGPDVPADGAVRYGSSFELGMDDDYSGHGSVSLHARAPDMANHTASTGEGDIDVLNSTLWLPVTTGIVPLQEFRVGDTVQVYRDGTLVTSATVPNYCWDASPPVVLHVGSPEHPGLFGLVAPQNQHPDTYVLLGFRGAPHDLGDPRRLDAISYAHATYPAAVLTLSNGAAVAQIGAVASVAGTPELYSLDYCYREDKGADLNPEDVLTIKRIVYVPDVGMLANDFEAAAGSSGLQQKVLPPPDVEIVPSFGPGAFTQWHDKVDGTTLQRWDYVTSGSNFLLAGPTLGNVHMAVAMAAHKKRHKTHGFVRGGVQPPAIGSIEVLVGDGTTIRVNGWYFPAPDTAFAPDPLVIDTAHPATSWVFAQLSTAHGLSGWVAAESVGFPSVAGHAYEAHWSALAPGDYRIVVGVRRLFSMTGATTGGTLQARLDYAVSADLFTVS